MPVVDFDNLNQVTFNGTDITRVFCGGVKVWNKIKTTSRATSRTTSQTTTTAWTTSWTTSKATSRSTTTSWTTSYNTSRTTSHNTTTAWTTSWTTSYATSRATTRTTSYTTSWTTTWTPTYSAGTANTAHSQTWGYSFVGEGNWIEIGQWTTAYAGTVTIQSKFTNDASKIVKFRVQKNNSTVSSGSYDSGYCGMCTRTWYYNQNLTVSVGDNIEYDRYLWGNYGNDRMKGYYFYVKYGSLS